MVLDYRIPDELKKSYKEKLEKEKEKLNPESQKFIEDAAENLKSLSNKIDTSKMPAPSFLMIVIGIGEFAYKREDGIFIVPIGCLKN